MSVISGKWYPKDSSTQYQAQIEVTGDNYQLRLEPATFEQTNSLSGSWSQVKISDRLGNTERKLTLADGSLFTTANNDAIDQLISQHKSSTHSSWSLCLHRHETKMSSVLSMFLLTVVCVFGFVKWGLPWTSHWVAQALPQKTGEFIGKQSLDFLDEYFLTPTEVSDSTQQQIITRFNSRLKSAGDDQNINYQLHFRDMTMAGMSMPNAFALPSGDIVLTDKFVELSSNADEIDSVLLHEMGHVEKRHGLEMLTQNSLTTMIVILVLGNPDGISELATGLGTALVSNHYSRQYETEADEYAFDKMLQVDINPQAFVDILTRMEEYSGQDMDSENADSDRLSDFLSTHPNTQQRVDMAKKYSQCFEQGLRVCD
ncbi:M48 family metallopeptidase [Psychrobacter sp. FDAARGOS_221]|uniref:M48 family metallopeptidase n=1 Tax=Psychrobacter sp. FDAARGOS_221 TaxID=1975705 RepID=UPI000BB530AB|nr:M48 family metallopeptidase [Psychrobacter sp. FDAARGOS_221]PNK61429.1 peptidase M48 Ste24p [Psychrobacter sp. FDAARGOS_221]